MLLTDNIELYNILENTDLLMVISSTTAIEAAMQEKGLIILQPVIPYHYELNDNDSDNCLVKSDAGIAVYDSGGLKNFLEKLIKSARF